MVKKSLFYVSIDLEWAVVAEDKDEARRIAYEKSPANIRDNPPDEFEYTVVLVRDTHPPSWHEPLSMTLDGSMTIEQALELGKNVSS